MKETGNWKLETGNLKVDKKEFYIPTQSVTNDEKFFHASLWL